MNKDKIIIRQATQGDAESIVKFNKEMAYETEGISLNLEKLTEGVKSVFKSEKNGFYIVAECDGNIVGQAMITYEWSDWRNAIFWWIQSVYVLPEYRKIGVFRSIFKQIKAMANQSNVCGLRLYVDRDNLIAKKAYQSLGMSESHYDLYEMMIE